MNEPKDRETKKAERRGKSALELLELLHERMDELDDWREDLDNWRKDVDTWRSAVDSRLGEGDKRFGRIEANVGLVMNSVRTLCQARGLDVEAGMLDRALKDWEIARHTNGQERDVPTNPENERPSDAE